MPGFQHTFPEQRETISAACSACTTVYSVGRPNTRDAYERALRQLHEWLADSKYEADDAGIAAYLGHLFQIGRAPATAAMVVGRLPRAPRTTSPQSSPPPTDRERMGAVGNPSA